MPKLPRISGAAIIKAIERLGFVRVRQSGSHVMMRRSSKGCVVPMHSEVKTGTLAGYYVRPKYRPPNLPTAYKYAQIISTC